MVFPHAPVIQQHVTGCALASTAWITERTYEQVLARAEALGIDITNSTLWSETTEARRLLHSYKVQLSADEIPFTNWESLPDRALLAVKWHLEQGKPHWHWVVFSRSGADQIVMDPKKGLKNNIRTDFGRIKPKWFIEIFSP
ncbi:hypothetical protein [Sneathiella sp.]|jgi:hypothetical protein|uniref:hypothetical protein n=1 Tax=Sneathiella sp. TaxID=1964365 RepID=UPI0039E3B0F9